MKYPKPIKITGSGKYLPERISSETLELRNNKLPKGFGELKNGVKYRHQATFESVAFMGARAAEAALNNAGLKLDDIDLMISAGATYDFPLPSQSCVIKSEMNGGDRTNFPAFDVNSTCLSFLSAFELAAKMLDGEQYNTILIVTSEIASKGLNTNNPETYTLFGDASVAFVLSYEEGGTSSFIRSRFETYSEGFAHTIIRGGGILHHFKDTPYDEVLFSFHMDGIKMLKLAKKTMPNFMHSFLNEVSHKLTDFDAIIPHQASKTGLQLFKKMFELKDSQVKENIENYGNCIAASIPLLLHDCIISGEVKRGDLCMLIGTSAGFSIGGLVFKY
jgi:3-oxoacyl-[acyl-carrier-protein] synthase-3